MKHLRELAKEFAQGKINQDEYRKQRTELIQGILAGNIQVPDREFLAPLAPPTDEDITAQGFDYDPMATTEIAVTKPGQKNKARTPAEPVASKTSERSFPIWLFVAISVAVLLLIVSVTALFILGTGDDTAPATEASTRTPVAGEAASQLIRIFLDQNNWREENIRQFEENWRKIGPAEQQAAAGLPVMNRLKNAIHKQILEERAMMALGDAESARRKEQILVEFANNVGIDDPAIVVSP